VFVAAMLVTSSCSDSDGDSDTTAAAGTGGSHAGSSATSGAGGKSAAGSGGKTAVAGASGKTAGVGGKAGEDSSADADSDAGLATQREQDGRKFTVDESMLAFDALPDPSVDSDRWTGVLDGAGYRIEVPKTWNGKLVMYAHGYAGTGADLHVTTPSIRRYLLEQGYAWAASSYSTNYYDVRTGVEDTNKLALAFKRLAGEHGRTLDEPAKRYLIGHSMGGHITGAAIEKEAEQTANNKVHYAAALPMCGVLGDTQLFNYFAAYQYAAQKLAGTSVVVTSADEFMNVKMQTQDALFKVYPTSTTAAGDQLKSIVRNLTGGARPGFDQGFATKTLEDAVWSTFGGDGTISGILARAVTDTRDVVYQLDDEPAQSDEERKFNEDVYRTTPEPDANALRSDGLRWIPQVNGEIDIPVLTLHTLGDLYVPFKMEQIYHERVKDKGNAERLVQRAIRGTGHCEFSYAEQADAFKALIDWEENGKKPDGDEVVDPAVLKQDTYGCKFTENTFNSDETTAGTLPTVRRLFAGCP
jgi:pimeloyl-ACP methyl ester carboxylesterase